MASPSGLAPLLYSTWQHQKPKDVERFHSGNEWWVYYNCS